MTENKITSIQKSGAATFSIDEIKENEYKTVAIQIPEGLKRNVFGLVEFLENETQANVIVSADPCFGACDVVNYELKNLDVEFVIHIGHTPMSDVENFWIPTLFVNAKSDLDVSSVVEKAVPLLKGKKIGLTSTAQHVHTFDKVKDILVKNKFEPVIGEGDSRIDLKGQILGCNFSAATSSWIRSTLFCSSAAAISIHWVSC